MLRRTRCLGVELAAVCAVVTGGESGIGKACATALARAGARVVLTYFADAAAGEAVAEAIERDGGQAMAWQTDVGDEASVERLFAAAEAAFGPVRLLVNSAGLNMSGTPVEQMALAQFDRVVRADLYGPFLTVSAVRARAGWRGGRRADRQRLVDPRARPARRRRRVRQRQGRARAADRDAGARAGAAADRRERGRPGMMLTPMNQSALDDPDELRRKEAAIPWGRAGTAEEVAELVLFLLSERAGYVTGTTVTIDGALSLTVAQGA